MCIYLTHSSENGWDGRSPKPSTAESGRFSRLLRDLRFVSKLAVLPQDSQIFRIHILLNVKIPFLEAYRFQNSEGLDGLKEYSLKKLSVYVCNWFAFCIVTLLLFFLFSFLLLSKCHFRRKKSLKITMMHILSCFVFFCSSFCCRRCIYF